jgi:C4-dicarboxylate-specific signal transduction histidine kinase
MEAIISHLRRFARRSDNKREPLRLGDQIAGAVSLSAGPDRAGGRQISRQRRRAQRRRVMGDAILIEQVIINLLSNALDAIEERRAATAGSRWMPRRTGGFVDLTVRDHGIGLGDLSPEEAVNPFVTSKEAGRGMGLGLSISYNIAKDMGGDLVLAPAPGQGVVARLRLPTVKHDEN